jgi:UDP-N-acetylglucosamine kinase
MMGENSTGVPGELRLPKKHLWSIFREAIEAPALAGAQAVEKPRVVFLGGQPGCGKSTVARSCEAIFEGEGCVHVDVDRVRALHPVYLPMVMNPTTEIEAPTAVQKDCSLWAGMLLSSAAQNQRNVLVDGTMRVPEQVRASAALMREHGYAMEARIMAVHEKASEVSLLQRFEHEKQIMGFGRTIPFEFHKKAADGIVDTVRAIEVEKLFDTLVIFDRSGNTIYENRVLDGEWEHEPRGAEVMHAFREASYDLEAKREIAALWDDVVDMMETRGAEKAGLTVVDGMRREAWATAGVEMVAEIAPVDLVVSRVGEGRGGRGDGFGR